MEVDLPWEVFAIALHPQRPVLATGFLEGHVSTFTPSPVSADSSYSYTLDGTLSPEWQTKRHKGSCRGLAFSHDGEKLVTVGRDGVIKLADSETGKVIAKDVDAHTYPRRCPPRSNVVRQLTWLSTLLRMFSSQETISA
jgi:WD repeat-containing protein 55